MPSPIEHATDPAASVGAVAGAKCIVCGCDDLHACAGGCSWISADPPVCSSCVREWILARLIELAPMIQLEAVPLIAGKIHSIRQDYTRLASANLLPSFRHVTQINRNAARFRAQLCRAGRKMPAAGARP